MRMYVRAHTHKRGCIKWKYFLIFCKSIFSVTFPNIPVCFDHLICLKVTSGSILEIIFV